MEIIILKYMGTFIWHYHGLKTLKQPKYEGFSSKLNPNNILPRRILKKRIHLQNVILNCKFVIYIPEPFL